MHPNSRKSLRRFAILATSIALMPSAFSQQTSNKTWTGTISLDWNTADNWDPSGVPATGDNVGIFNGNIVSTSLNAASDLGQLLINGNSTLDLGHRLGINAAGGLFVGAAGSAGTLHINSGGALSTTFTNDIFRIGNDTTGILTLSAGGGITTGGGIDVGREGGGNGTFTQTGGTLTQSAGDFRVGAFGATGNYSISAGTANISNLRLSFAGIGSGIITQSGGTVNQSGEGAIGWANAGNATYNMEAGTLNFTNNRMRFGVGGSAGSENVFNQTGGKVTVSGRIDMGEGQNAVSNNLYQISAGTLTLTGGDKRILVGAFDLGRGTFTVSGTALVDAGAFVLGENSTAAGTVNLNGGTVFINKIQPGNSSAAQLNLNGGTIKAKGNEGNLIGGAALAVDLQAGGVTIDSNTFEVAVSSPLPGVGALTKTGAGTLTLAANNSYSGNTTISNGTLQVGSGGSGSLGAGSVLNNAALVYARTGDYTVSNAFSGTGTMTVNTGNIATFAGGSISGSGNLIKTGSGQMWLGASAAPQTVALTGANSVIDVQAGVLRNEFGNSAWSGNMARLNVESGAFFDIWDGEATVDALSGAGTINKGWSSDHTLTIGVKNGSGTFTGTIYNNRIDLGYGGNGGGNLSLVKNGSGTQTLSGNNTYAGATTINGGTLLVSGSISDSSVTINTTGKLGGGTTLAPGVTGAVEVNAGGTIAPGFGIGTLNTRALSLNNTATFALEIDTTARGTDLVAITGNLSLADADDAVLTISDLAPAAFASGTLVFITYSGTWDGDLFTYGGKIIADGGLLTVGANIFTFDYNLGGNSVVLIAVPEPNVIATLLGGSAMLLGLRRRRA